MLSYSLSGGADKDAFTIDQKTGQIKVGSQYEAELRGHGPPTRSIVKADDPFGLSDTITVTITVDRRGRSAGADTAPG